MTGTRLYPRKEMKILCNDLLTSLRDSGTIIGNGIDAESGIHEDRRRKRIGQSGFIPVLDMVSIRRFLKLVSTKFDALEGQ